MRGLFVVEAQVQAQAMLAVVDREHAGALERLRRDPVAELSGWTDIELSLVEETSVTDRCSVAGSYEPAPPTLVVAESASRRRRGFTALHELGHHLQQTDLELGDATYQYSDPEQFQEEACDAFAAQVLLPDHDLVRGIDPRGPVAQDVVDLFTTYSSASREACCVWAARHLTGAGAVVLLDGAGTVLFAAPRGFIPPARGSDQSGTPLIAAALRNRGGVVTRDETHVIYRNGGASAHLYGQAAWFDDDYLIAIIASDNVAWRPLALPRPGTERSAYGSWRTCEICEEDFKVTQDPCTTCQQPKCDNGHCGCTVARTENDRTCTQCRLKLHLSRFAPGSTVCRDCA